MNHDSFNGATISDIRNIINISQEYLLLKLFDMGHFAACAESCCVLPGVVKTLTTKRKDVSASEKYVIDKETFNKNFTENIKAAKKLKRYTDNRMSLFELIRSVYPEFCTNMESKVGEEDFALYKKSKADLKKLLIHSINPDPSIFLSEQLQTYQDNLAAVIDTKDFSRACNIEDYFVLSELDNFLCMFHSLPEEEQKKFKTNRFSVENNSISALSLINKIQTDRRARIERQKSIESLYDKLDNKSYISISGTNPEER